MDKSKFTLVFITLLFPLTLLAQPQVEWVWTDSVAGTNASNVDLTLDNGAIVLGWSNSSGILARLNEDGETAWINHEAASYGRVVHLDNDGFCFMGGQRLVTMDSMGVLVDSVGVIQEHIDIARFTCMERAGNRILAMYEYEYNDQDSDYHWGYGYGAYLFSDGSFDRYRFGGEAMMPQEEYTVHSLCKLEDNALLMGLQLSFWPHDLILWKRDGNDNWRTTIDPGEWMYSNNTQLAVDHDGIFCATMLSDMNLPNAIRLFRFSTEGDSLWYREIAGAPDTIGTLANLSATTDGGALLTYPVRRAGLWTVHIAKTNSSGDILWSEDIPQDSSFAVTAAVLNEDGALTVVGTVNPTSTGNRALRVMRINTNTTPVTDSDPVLASEFALHPNYPNPFNPSTEISFDMPYGAPATLKVYDILGREVATLADGILEAGTHRVTFDGTGLASGVYIYRLESNNFVQSRKMVLMK